MQLPHSKHGQQHVPGVLRRTDNRNSSRLRTSNLRGLLTAISCGIQVQNAPSAELSTQLTGISALEKSCEGSLLITFVSCNMLAYVSYSRKRYICDVCEDDLIGDFSVKYFIVSWLLRLSLLLPLYCVLSGTATFHIRISSFWFWLL